jgi:hypothetical protein
VSLFIPSALGHKRGPGVHSRRTALILLLDPAVNGLYLLDGNFTDPFHWASDPEMAGKLWQLSEELVGEKFLAK